MIPFYCNPQKLSTCVLPNWFSPFLDSLARNLPATFSRIFEKENEQLLSYDSHAFLYFVWAWAAELLSCCTDDPAMRLSYELVGFLGFWISSSVAAKWVGFRKAMRIPQKCNFDVMIPWFRPPNFWRDPNLLDIATSIDLGWFWRTPCCLGCKHVVQHVEHPAFWWSFP